MRKQKPLDYRRDERVEEEEEKKKVGSFNYMPMSNHTGGDGGSFSSGNTGEEVQQHQQQQQKNPFHGSNLGPSSTPNSNGSTSQPQPIKKKRNLPGTPDPTAEVIALSPTTLMATNRFVCEICNKGFQRDQNLQLHRRGHNLPWKLRQRTSNEIRKRVYICPEMTCVHHNPSRALGDLTGIKKHFCRKHGEKKWKCDKCSKKYAVQSDWKAHSKTCGTREYKCDCGTIFSRRDSFITHRAFCDALAEENSKVNQGVMANLQGQVSDLISSMPMNNDTDANTNTSISMSDFDHDIKHPLKSLSHDLMPKSLNMAGGMFSSSSGALFGPRSSISSPSSCLQLSGTATTFDGFQDGKTGRPVSGSAHMSATALLQKAAQMGATVSTNINPPMLQRSFAGMAGSDQLSGMRGFGGMHQNISYDHLQPHTDQTQLVGIDGGGFTNQFLQKTPQEIQSQFFDGSGTDPTPINDMGVFTSANGMFMGSDQQQQHQQHHMFLKNMGNSGVAIPTGGRNLGASRFGGSGGGDVMTVDFLGVGGTSSVSLHEQQQQQGLEFEGVGEHRMQGLHQFHGQGGGLEKSMWDV